MAWLSARSGLRSQHLLQWCRPEPCSDVRTPHVIKAFHGPHAAQSIGGKPVAAPGPLSLLSVPSSCPHSEISSLGQYKHNNGRVSNECIRMGSAASQPKDSGSSTLRGRNRKPAPSRELRGCSWGLPCIVHGRPCVRTFRAAFEPSANRV